MQKITVPSHFYTRTITFCAVLAALSIVLGKFLQIPIGDSIRLSFENLPILLASLLFGPLVGGAVGVTADILGCLIRGFNINPIITFGALCMGVLPAFFLKLSHAKNSFRAVLISVLLTHGIASMLIKSVGLFVFYQTALPVLLLRIPIYLCIGTAESLIITKLLQFPAFAGFRRNGGR